MAGDGRGTIVYWLVTAGAHLWFTMRPLALCDSCSGTGAMFSKSSARLTCLFLPVHMHGSLRVAPLHLRFHTCTLKEISCVIRTNDFGTLHWRQKTPPKDRYSSNTSLRNYICAPACFLARAFTPKLFKLYNNLFGIVVRNLSKRRGSLSPSFYLLFILNVYDFFINLHPMRYSWIRLACFGLPERTG